MHKAEKKNSFATELRFTAVAIVIKSLGSKILLRERKPLIIWWVNFRTNVS